MTVRGLYININGMRIERKVGYEDRPNEDFQADVATLGRMRKSSAMATDAAWCMAILLLWKIERIGDYHEDGNDDEDAV